MVRCDGGARPLRCDFRSACSATGAATAEELDAAAEEDGTVVKREMASAPPEDAADLGGHEADTPPRARETRAPRRPPCRSPHQILGGVPRRQVIDVGRHGGAAHRKPRSFMRVVTCRDAVRRTSSRAASARYVSIVAETR